MQIRTAQYTPNSTGSPAVGYKYHIGEPNKDPTIDDNKLVTIPRTVSDIVLEFVTLWKPLP